MSRGGCEAASPEGTRICRRSGTETQETDAPVLAREHWGWKCRERRRARVSWAIAQEPSVETDRSAVLLISSSQPTCKTSLRWHGELVLGATGRSRPSCARRFGAVAENCSGRRVSCEQRYAGIESPPAIRPNSADWIRSRRSRTDSITTSPATPRSPRRTSQRSRRRCARSSPAAPRSVAP